MEMNPITLMHEWIENESTSGNPFPMGAVLSTVSKEGFPHSRIVGTKFDENGVPKFHTSPTTRKVLDIENSNRVSLTYSFQTSLRSISLDGELVPLDDSELDLDWLSYDQFFRRDYLVFGGKSGVAIEDNDRLRVERAALSVGSEEKRPSSFIGFKFGNITRMVFYSVQDRDFADCDLFEKTNSGWIHKTIVP